MDGNSIEDADNVMKHILSRLFEFLYISVYRETTFDEIFKNADPNVFLEAVGISKKDFEVLNKYKIFQEDVLNNYIHDFFVNESLGSRINLDDENIRKQYRNSFDWFGFGLESDEEQEFDEKLDNGDSLEQVELFDESDQQNTQIGKIDEYSKIEIKDNINYFNQVKIEDKESLNYENLVDRIRHYLENSKPVKASKIAEELNISKKEINQVLCANSNMFKKDIFFNWSLK